ncbi:glutamine synthetase 2 cytoplasmic-like [Aricia agestis]|uniref:glutamine synthetase 2 cytoplasmic-like n=1 Tax=Aricia agestis TaxID=91739 RepID=UPI001C201B6D|nr:glutamine synthetase 2 cytoplasmic-like [Aricia agestis]XP_041976596.1 glutamine synthetase 2 cytoplasmic-like [Aricia agestis]
MNTVPIVLNKAAMRKYDDLTIPCEAVLAGYVWIDGTGINLRSKDRTLDFFPESYKDLPIWYFDGSNTQQAERDNSDTFIFPQVIYHDPFRRGNHILVLADTYKHNYQPTATNYRKDCLLLSEKAEVEEPWFGFNQEFFLMSTDGRPVGWPPGGFPSPPGPYYCAVGANRIVARDLMEAFYRCCLFAGVQINGINPGTTPSQWNFQIGPSPGIKAADDLWISRYILCRLAEEYGAVASFEPQPVEYWPGNGCFAYFSTKEMREEDGIMLIEKAIDKLARRHGAHMTEYDASSGADNARRLTGKTSMPNFKDFTAGVANRGCSVRIPRQVSEDKRGYLEDRRPAANADPYRVISVMLKTCVFDE